MQFPDYVRHSAVVVLLATALPLLVSTCKKPPIGHPPATPAKPMGISNGGYNTTYEFSTTTTDPDTDSVAVRFAWGDGTTSDWSEWIASGETATLSHAWSSANTYQVKAQAKDRPGLTSDWSEPLPVNIIATRAPNTPGAPTGPSSARKDSLCTFTTIATDPDGDGVSYRFDWGTGDTSDWTDWVPSGQPATMQYAFRRAGTPGVRAQARDVSEALSAWSNPHSVTVPNPHPPWSPYVELYSGGGVAGETLSFAASASDPDGDSVAVRVSWGDGDTSDWSDLAPPSGAIAMEHAWSDSGTYPVKAQAMDEDGATSDWSAGCSVYVWRPKWRYQTGGPLSSPAIAADGTVYVGSNDGYLYALNPDGTLKWRHQTGGPLSSPAIAADGTVYVGSNDGYLNALSADGTLKWRYQTACQIHTSPALATDGTVYFGAEDSCVYAINQDGSLKWRYVTGGLARSSPAIASDGTVYVGSSDLRLYAFDPSGALRWSYETPGSVGSSPAIALDGAVYVGAGKYLYAIDAAGEFKWRCLAGNTVVSSPAIAPDGTVYVGSYADCLLAVDPTDGTRLWYYETDDNVLSSPAVTADGTVYFGCDDCSLYALDPEGNLVCRYQTGGMIESSPAVAADGTVYVGSGDRYLYAIEGNYPLATSPWPKFHHDNRNTGRVGGR